MSSTFHVQRLIVFRFWCGTSWSR